MLQPSYFLKSPALSLQMGRDSSSSMATRYKLDGPGIELPIPVAERCKARVCGRSLTGTADSDPPGAWMFVLCVLYSKDKRKRAWTIRKKEVRIKYKKRTKKFPVGARFSAVVRTLPVSHPVFYKMGTGSLYRG